MSLLSAHLQFLGRMGWGQDGGCGERKGLSRSGDAESCVPPAALFALVIFSDAHGRNEVMSRI